MEKVFIKKHSRIGILWFVGWLFTIGYCHLSFSQGIAAIVIWPYYIGASIAAFVR